MKRKAPERRRSVPQVSDAALPDSVALCALPDLKIMGVSVFDPVWSRRWHRDPSVELLCVVRGRMTLSVAEAPSVKMGPGDFAFVPANVAHRDVFDISDEPEIFLAQFEWPAQIDFFREVSNARLAALPEHVRSDTLALILRMRDHAVSESDMDRTLARSLLHTLLLQLWAAVRAAREERRAPGAEVQDRRHDLMMRAKQHLDAHCNEPQSLSLLAERLGVSSYYLSRVFSRESGFSLTAYLTSVRLNKARELLRAGACRVSEAAYAVGYESSAYFSRAFKHHFGVAPSAVRRAAPPGRR